jgi:hypothetical protein
MKKYLRISVEIFSIVFLLYTNIIMGYYTRSSQDAKKNDISSIIKDISTPEMFATGLVAGVVSFMLVEIANKSEK